MEYTTGKGWNPKIGGLGLCVSFSKEVFSGSMLFFGGVSARIHSLGMLAHLLRMVSWNLHDPCASLR